MKLVGLFPGLGSEYSGMLKPISEHPFTKEIFNSINQISGIDIYRYAIDKTAGYIHPLHAQLAVFGTSVCHWHLMNSVSSSDFFCLAGHSLGFYTALYATGSLSLKDCVTLIIKVHQAITEKTKDMRCMMAAIIGLKEDVLEDICKNAGMAYIANVNTSTQIVISGTSEDVQKACSLAIDSGALSIKVLNNDFPLHSQLMLGIDKLLNDFVYNLDIREPVIPLISHLNCSFLDASSIADHICTQLYRKVIWRDTLRFFNDKGIKRFIEIGPSDKLSKMARWIIRDAEFLTTEEELNCQIV